MTRHAHGYGRLALTATTLALAAVLAGCAQSSDTTSTGAAGSGPASTAPSSTSTPTSPSSTTTTSTTSGAIAGAGPLTVSPTTGSPHSIIHFAFTAPAATAASGSDQLSAGLSVIGSQKHGCVGLHRQPLSSMTAGQQMSVSVGPAQLGGDWCPGTYTARVEVLARPRCGPGMMCPQFIRVVAVLGPATFKISG